MRCPDSLQRLHEFLASVAFILAAAVNIAAASPVKEITPQDPAKTTQTGPGAQPLPESDGMDQLRKSVRRLTVEVAKLTKRVGDLEKERLFDVTRVLLVGEELRAEALQARLRESLERQFIFQARVDQVDNQLKPENIERLFIGVGLVRPEEARESVRRRLSLEKQGLLAQLELVRQERNRFQSALATADLAIQRLRLRLAEAGPP